MPMEKEKRPISECDWDRLYAWNYEETQQLRARIGMNSTTVVYVGLTSAKFYYHFPGICWTTVRGAIRDPDCEHEHAVIVVPRLVLDRERYQQEERAKERTGGLSRNRRSISG